MVIVDEWVRAFGGLQSSPSGQKERQWSTLFYITGTTLNDTIFCLSSLSRKRQTVAFVYISHKFFIILIGLNYISFFLVFLGLHPSCGEILVNSKSHRIEGWLFFPSFFFWWMCVKHKYYIYVHDSQSLGRELYPHSAIKSFSSIQIVRLKFSRVETIDCRKLAPQEEPQLDVETLVRKKWSFFLTPHHILLQNLLHKHYPDQYPHAKRLT